MSSICLYFHVHQPYRVRRYSFFDIGKERRYFGEEGDSDRNNARVMEKVARKCYLPATALWRELLARHPELRLTFSISGVALDQFARYAPEVLESFKTLVQTGRVELLAETYYHSLAFLHSPCEFREQVARHRAALAEHFGVTPTVFRNTELVYRNDIAAWVADMGFRGMLAEGWERYLGWRSPHFVYHAKGMPALKLLLKSYRLSDDIAFRFSERSWKEYPLTADKFAQWVSAHNGNGEVINLFMDFETLGEHHWEETGMFDFWRALPAALLRHPDNDFVTASEALARYAPVGEYDVPDYLSWADTERDLTAWAGNPLQRDALRAIYALEPLAKSCGDEELLEVWRLLQTSDHFYYMCTKWWADGDVHAYFSPYDSPYDAYISYMNVVNDLRLRIEESCAHRRGAGEAADALPPAPVRAAACAPRALLRRVAARLRAWKGRLRHTRASAYH